MDSTTNFMNTPFLIAMGVTFTAWKVVGWTGALLFAARWFVQAWVRTVTGDKTIPTVFWVLSLCGAGMTLLYFVFGKNDSVGIIQNLFPASVAAYNLTLDVIGRRKVAGG